MVCDATELTAEPGGLVYQGRRVQAVSEQTFEPTAGSVARALLGGAVDVYNGPATDVLFDKRNLALLSERQGSDLFDREERAFIAAHVPWTREVSDADTTWEGERARLSDVLSEFRERLVLKPAIGTQGRGVQIGRRLSAQAWEEVVAAALSSTDPWVVQEHVESLPYLYLDRARGCCEHDVVWGLYAFGSSYGGSFLRLMSKAGGSGVVNSAQGATEGLIMEVEA